jgi:hypothetical protein
LVTLPCLHWLIKIPKLPPTRSLLVEEEKRVFREIPICRRAVLTLNCLPASCVVSRNASMSPYRSGLPAPTKFPLPPRTDPERLHTTPLKRLTTRSSHPPHNHHRRQRWSLQYREVAPCLPIINVSTQRVSTKWLTSSCLVTSRWTLSVSSSRA